jgi:hypothetical protein
LKSFFFHQRLRETCAYPAASFLVSLCPAALVSVVLNALLSFPREGEEFRRMAEKTMDNAAAAVGGAASTAADGGLAALMGGLGAALRPP